MSHNVTPIDFHAGDARPLDFTIYDEDPDNPGQPDLTKPVDLSGATAIRWGIGKAAGDAAPLLSKSLGSGITVVTGPEAIDNVARVALAKADTKDLAPGRHYYELEVADAGDDWTGPHGLFHLHASLLK